MFPDTLLGSAPQSWFVFYTYDKKMVGEKSVVCTNDYFDELINGSRYFKS